MKSTIFNLDIGTMKVRDGDVADDIRLLRESLYKAQEAIAILSHIIAQQNRTAIETKAGLIKNANITSVNLSKWSDSL